MRAHEFADQGAAGIILYAADTGRYGLQQRSDSINDPGQWAAWGGGREPGESLEQCATRELGEESGYTGPIKLKRLAENAKYVTFIGVVPSEFEPVPCDEWKDYCWVEAGDWPAPMHPGVAAALKNIPVNENFADGKVKGKSRPGRVARAGASCSGSVTDLRAKARKYGGEKGKMYHWCANMKSGKNKANEEEERYEGPYDGHNFGGAQIGEADTINKNMRAKDFTPDHEQEADYGPEYQAMVKRVGQKARAQEKAKQQQQPKKDVNEAPGAETLAHNQSTVASNEKAFDLEEYSDPELAKTLAYAGVHYPNYKKKPEAFMKWASRAIAHSEEQDNHHNQQFAEIHSELSDLKQLLARISKS